jgi:hypothetical protein
MFTPDNLSMHARRVEAYRARRKRREPVMVGDRAGLSGWRNYEPMP